MHNVTSQTGQPIVSAAEVVCQLRMIKAQQMHNRGMEVVNVTGLFRNLLANIVGGSVDIAAFHAATRQPTGESILEVITAVLLTHIG